MVQIPALDGVDHKYIDLGDGVTIHVADAGPAEGPPVMLVHGFPENWWEWHELITPLAADGYRVLCPDLRGAGWSSAPRSRYLKNDMADDLAAVLDRLGVGPVKLVAHDWGGPVAFIMMLRHPGKGDRLLRSQHRSALCQTRPVVDAQRLAILVPDSDGASGHRPAAHRRPQRAVISGCWVLGSAAGFRVPDDDVAMYVECMRQPGHAVAGSRWYRTFQSTEMLRWVRGEFDDVRVDVPVRWLSGTADPVLTPDLIDGYAEHISDFEVEFVDGVGHWIVEQRPDLVLDRLRAFLAL